MEGGALTLVPSGFAFGRVSERGLVSGAPDSLAGTVSGAAGDPDGALVERCRLGERSAFGELVDRHQAGLVRFARGMVHNEDDARDLAQETFVRAYQHLDRFDARRRFSVWLYGIASHVCLDWLRRRKRRDVLDLRVDLPDTGPSPEMLAIQGEMAEKVRGAVGDLPLGYRELVLLHYGEGFSCAEAGAALGISHGAARVRLFRAREQLRQKLGSLIVEPAEGEES